MQRDYPRLDLESQWTPIKQVGLARRQDLGEDLHPLNFISKYLLCQINCQLETQIPPFEGSSRECIFVE